jgi:hypothetical protein
MYYDSDWFCHPFHPFCTMVENISGDCLSCELGYEINQTNKRCEIPQCPPSMWRQNLFVCKNNPPYCVLAEDYTGKCLQCLGPLYEINPTNSLCRLIPCLGNQWRDSQNVCKPNPANCVTAVDISGACMIASPGWYVTLSGTVVQCNTIDPRCSTCRNGDGLCTTC